MEGKDRVDFRDISLRMRSGLTRTRRLRVLFRVLTVGVYACALVWFAFCIFGGLLIDRTDYQTSVNTGKYVMIGFAVFVVLHFAFTVCFRRLDSQESMMMSEIIHALFPGARYTPTGGLSRKMLSDSRLFSSKSVNATSYGRLDLPVGNGWLSIADAGVTSADSKDFSSMNFIEVLYQYFIRPILGARVESTMHSFRGMFGYCQLNRPSRGFVMLVPDRLEGKIGYLAQSIQGMRDRYGAKFVHLEDPEFEKLFTVYADDEIEARMVLTPAMMRRLTSLRKNFSRDMMLSFNGDMFYYASETPDGFLRPGRKSLDDGQLLEQIYREVEFCISVEEEFGSTEMKNM